ncbi:MAG: hypothetical protein UHT92_04205 [Prevotella sp.]|jgi:hypothetical protein|nr:hypothetical protein [Prevotella sp.]
MTPTKEIIFQNILIKIRNSNFNSKEDSLPMSPWKWRYMDDLLLKIDGMTQYNNKEIYQFVSKIQEKRRVSIYENERHSIDTSIETLHLLNLIVFNIRQVETNEISIPGIIALGKYLREKGQHVDFVKLEDWIRILNIKKLTSLLASFLVQAFNFEKNEVPFLYSEHKNANELLFNTLFIVDKKGGTSHPMRLFRYSKYGYLAYLRTKTKTLLESIEE